MCNVRPDFCNVPVVLLQDVLVIITVQQLMVPALAHLHSLKCGTVKHHNQPGVALLLLLLSQVIEQKKVKKALFLFHLSFFFFFSDWKGFKPGRSWEVRGAWVSKCSFFADNQTFPLD